jgi:hypothetical protein
MVFKSTEWGYGLDSSDSGRATEAGPYEHGYKYTGSIKREEFLHT